jgi:hypothetical protein
MVKKLMVKTIVIVRASPLWMEMVEAMSMLIWRVQVQAKESQGKPFQPKHGVKKKKDKRAPTSTQVEGSQLVGGVRRSTRVSKPLGE